MRHPLFRLVLVSSLAVAACAMANGQVVKKGNAYLMRIKFTKGQKLSYGITMGLGAGMGNGTSGMVISVLSVKNGIASTKLNVEPVRLGKSVIIGAQSANQSYTNRLQPAGGPMNDQSTSQFSGSYPPKPVKVGQTWMTTFRMNQAAVDTPIQTQYKFVGLKKVNGVQVAVLSMVLHGQYSGTGTTLIRVSDGTPQSVVLNLVLKIAANGNEPPQPFKVAFSTIRR